MNRLQLRPAVKNLYFAFLVILSIVKVVAFSNVFFTGEGYYNGIRTGNIFFLLEYSLFVLPIAGALLLLNLRQPIDWLSVILVVFTAWIFLVGRDGGIWHDEKAWYFFGGVVFFILTKAFLDQLVAQSKVPAEWILVGVLTAITVIGAIEAIMGELQVFGEYRIYHSLYRVTGTFFNPAPYAGYLIASLPYAAGLAFYAKSLARDRQITRTSHKTRLSALHATNLIHWLGLLGCMLMLAILPATQSRAAWIGLMVATGYFLLHHYNLVDKVKTLYTTRKKFVIIGAIALILVLAIGLGGLYQFKKDSADGRMLIWKVATTILKQSPWTGTGFNTFQAHYAPALAAYFEQGHGTSQEEMLAGNVQWAFNEPLQFGVELGIPGAILYLGLVLTALFLPIKETWKEHKLKIILLAARCSLIAIFTFGLFSYPFYSAPITLLFFFSLGIIASSLRGIRTRCLSFIFRGAMLVLLISIAFHTYGNVSERKHAYWLWDEAELLYRMKAYEAANKSFEKALPVLNTHGLFMQQYGKCLQMTNDYKRAKDILEHSGRYYKDDFWYLTLGEVNKELGNVTEAEIYYNAAATMVPHKLYPKYLLAKLYYASGQGKKAKKTASDILNSDVKVMSTAVEEIRNEMKTILNDQKEE